MSEIKTKVSQSNGVILIKNELWVLFNEKMEQYEYNRFVSKIQKDIKNLIFALREQNEWDFNYFVDVEIRDSPSNNAFLSIKLNMIKNNKKTIQTKLIKEKILSYLSLHEKFKPYLNIKKRKIK